MSVVIILMLASLGVALLFLAAFIWSVCSGQYEDTLTPSMRMLLDDATPAPVLGKAGRETVPLPVLKKQQTDGKPTTKE